MASSVSIQPGHEVAGFTLDKMLGSGAFAQVWRGCHKLTGSIVATKVIAKSSLNSPQAKTRFQREVSLLKQMDHPFIAEFFQVSEDDEYFYLIMENVENGNLLDYVNNNGRLAEDVARKYFEQLLASIEYLHKTKMVCHRDLKCENVLIDRYYNIRLIDFGLSNVFSEVKPNLNTTCGSPAYAAPEMIKGEPYTQSADIWSLGVLLYAIVIGHLPFDDDNMQRLLHKIIGTEPYYPQSISPALSDLLHKLLTKDPEFRIDIDRIKEHTWFSQNEYSTMLQWIAQPEQSEETTIKRSIIDELAKHGVDTKSLSESLIVGEFTDLTAMYRIHRRKRMADNMNGLMQSMGQSALQKLPKYMALVSDKSLVVPEKFPTLPRVGGPQLHSPSPTPTVLQPHTLRVPVAPGMSNRRMSRPVAVRRPIASPSPVGLNFKPRDC